jgi:RNA polymerase sigma factor FliA
VPLSLYSSTLVEQHLPAIRALAMKVKSNLPPHVELEDLISAGYEEVIWASKRYDPSMNDCFWGYAKIRVYGAMIDFLRENDIVSRRDRVLLNAISGVADEYFKLNGEFPDDNYISKKLSCELRRIKQVKANAGARTVVSLGDGEWSDESDHALDAENQQLLAKINLALGHLTDKNRRIILMRFYEEYSVSEIAKAFGVTPSAITQTIKRCLEAIRKSIDTKAAR